jgi:uncharacterized protein with von Willebrand factor type A (vWA) domain
LGRRKTCPYPKILRRYLNPESPQLWGSGDSDMLDYLPFCDATYEVSNLAQLTEAVDRLLTDR